MIFKKIVISIRRLLITFFLLCLVSCKTPPEFHSKNLIEIRYGESLGLVNRRIFGNNMVAYDPTTYEDWDNPYYGYSDFGAGIWDPKLRKNVSELVGLAKGAGISVLRFPGGCGAHHYDWKKSVGTSRVHFLYGIDEFLKTCREIGAEPIVTLSYFSGDENDAADLVEYLNAPNDGSNPNGGIDWAFRRAEHGHIAPYRVTYFEFGNEDWHGDHRNIREISPDEYAERYLRFYVRLKAVDPSIQVGVILAHSSWDQRVLRVIGERFDFGIIHMYFSGGWVDQALENVDPRTIFLATLAEPARYEQRIKQCLDMMREASGRAVPIAFTEYNTAFAQNNPVAYRHSLGGALLNAELLRILLHPENNILLANYWQFSNSHWGMVANGFEGNAENLYRPYYKRPQYYVFEMYARHFGDVLIGAHAQGETYLAHGHDVPYLSVQASKRHDGGKVYMIVLNKNMKEFVRATIDLKDFTPSHEGDMWILNGPGVAATNEVDHHRVKMTHKTFVMTGSKFEMAFEPHSLTAVEIGRK